ncbi:MAG: helix-turn-helix domain-containing protein [Sphingosinicella sp.]
MAEGNIELVVTRLTDFVAVTLRGPVTQARAMECPPHGEWIAIRFGFGTYFPRLPTQALMDRLDLDLPVLSGNRFWFFDLSWEIPTFDNAEDFVARLALAGVVAREHSVGAVIEGDVEWMSRRSVQRHFVKATGLTLSGFQQISRARRAAALLASGRSILDTTFEAGYFDQAHLTRSMKQLIGTTPAKLIREQPQLSFSYKTDGE